MDFIVGLPRTQKGNDSIWVIVDRLTKVAHFVPVKTTFETHKLAERYIDNILKLHGASKSIVSDRGYNLPPSSGGVCIRPWAPTCTTVPPSTHRQIGRQRE
jgi:hypothetical protein